MNQDAFRSLLSTSRHAHPESSKQSVTATGIRSQKKAKSSGSTEPSFQPRKVKNSNYRDRAEERRQGAGNDYAQVEALLEDFEKRTTHQDKNALEQQRKYLGGDSEHTILVKGLDMSLLEQNRARAAASTEDDDTLEQAFADATATAVATETRKRTREEIIQDLKAQRQNGPADQPAESAVRSSEEERLALEHAKKAGKFKPIGFKPIGQREEKPKKRKVKGVSEKNEGKKKRKVEKQSQPSRPEVTAPDQESLAVAADETKAASSSSTVIDKQPEPEPLLDEDFDIFADAGDYQGYADEDDGSDQNADEEKQIPTAEAVRDSQPASEPPSGHGGWFGDSDSKLNRPHVAPTRPSPPKSPPPEIVRKAEEGDVVRLKPLESSALPSIRDFLAMDEAAEKAEKRRARKEKKKKSKGAGDDDD
ncbi:RED-like protein N-terminal region-domain-containing protein [Phlebopus sp. FC_14]|nr:RED-like protein N-terminal region-domain-containing protein [Phlebopus sp. FC_14]